MRRLAAVMHEGSAEPDRAQASLLRHIRRLPCCGAGRAGGGLPAATRQLHRALCGGGRDRPDGAARRPAPRAAAGKAVRGGEPPRRRHRARRVLCGEAAGRRLHAAARHEHDHGDQRHRLQGAALRSDPRPRAGREPRRGAVHPRRHAVAAGHDAGRARALRQGKSAGADLRLEWPWRRRASLRRAVEERHRDRRDPCPDKGSRRRSTTSSPGTCR